MLGVLSVGRSTGSSPFATEALRLQLVWPPSVRSLTCRHTILIVQADGCADVAAMSLVASQI